MKDDARIRKVVIAGGGTAGWIAGLTLAHQFRGLVDVALVESEQIGTIGVGESTIPPIRGFHKLVQIDERAFMREVACTFKLGISFEHWLRPGDRYFHPFGVTGRNTQVCAFHQFWLDGLRAGDKLIEHHRAPCPGSSSLALLVPLIVRLGDLFRPSRSAAQ